MTVVGVWLTAVQRANRGARLSKKQKAAAEAAAFIAFAPKPSRLLKKWLAGWN
jgi:hypothetical protein